MEIYKKLLEVQKEVGAVSKDSENPFFKSKYFDINGLIQHVEPILTKHGLVLLQPIKEGKQYSIIYDAETGENADSCLELPHISDPQKLGSAVTYYRRYTLCSLLALQAEDDDANAASKHVNKPPAKIELIEGSENYIKVVKALANKSTIEQVKKKYALSFELERKLELI
tara:strand:- start:5009 stop:5518 length:510 start_codon:yes stop_codon:yes gene_type:complete